MNYYIEIDNQKKIISWYEISAKSKTGISITENQYKTLRSKDDYYYEYDTSNNEIIDVFDTEKSRSIITTKIKKKAEGIIYSRYSKEKQLNAHQRGLEILDILISGNSLSESEVIERQEIRDAGEWIKNIRKQSNDFEDDVKIMSEENIKNYKIEYIL